MAWSPPLPLCPSHDRSRHRCRTSRGAGTGVKVRHRTSAEIVIVGLVGSPHRPTSIIGGRYDPSGRLRIVARARTPPRPRA